MSFESRELFRSLEPPPGGVEAFRQRLEQRTAAGGRPVRRYLAFGAAFAALACIVFVALPESEESGAGTVSVVEAPAFDRLLGRDFEPAATVVAVNDEPVPLAEIPSSNARVRIYEIATQ